MAVPTLLEVIKLELKERGYKEVEPGGDTQSGVWETPEGYIDHILPAVVDCFEKER